MNELQDVIDEGNVSNTASEITQSPEHVGPRQKVLSMAWRIYLVITQHVSAVVDIQAS